MDLVTVTCIRDFNAMIKQASSIQKNLSPCRHWVIVNDQYIDRQLWQTALSPYYTNHELVLVFPEWKEWDFNFVTKIFKTPYHPIGYKIQQVHKLLISEKLTEDYLITDSANFFVKQTDINSWRDIIGSGVTIPMTNMSSYSETIPYYAKKLGCNIPKLFLQPTTPFVINLDVIRSVKKLRPVLKWFNEVSLPQSEFVLYSMLAHQHGLFDGNTPMVNNKSRVFKTDEAFILEDNCSWEIVRIR